MAMNTAVKRASAAGVGLVFLGPTIFADGSIDAIDRAPIGWGYHMGATGTLTFHSTVLVSGVDSEVYDGVTQDSDGNLRVRGTLYEGTVT